MRLSSLRGFVALVIVGSVGQPILPNVTGLPTNPILFVTQVPIPGDFTTIGSVFGNHRGSLASVGRGGDLYIRYADGSLKNLTAAAGYGTSGLQGASAIAVRDPSVHWSGTKALFSMVVGAPTAQYQDQAYFFQIYEISGLGNTDTVAIARVNGQPVGHNNVSPIYASDDQIIFTSDRPRDGSEHLYPQLDEYEEQPTVTGLWKLNPGTGGLALLNHAPSGNFTPIVDSFGRVVFSQWDHLQRDQQADTDAEHGGPCSYCTFNYASEDVGAAALKLNTEVYPEPRSSRTDLLAGTNLYGHSFNQFFPWTINEDGTASETLGHLGRHELQAYIPASIKDDPNVYDYFGQLSRANPNAIRNMLQIKEDPSHPGVYFGVDAPEFQTHASGMIISMSVPPGTDADVVKVSYVTNPATANVATTPTVAHTGFYRDPSPLSDGTLVAVHANTTREDANVGTSSQPLSRYDYRVKTLKLNSGFWVPDQSLTPGIAKTVSWWDPDTLISYSGPLWELQPVEVRARPRPVVIAPPIAATPEQQMFVQAGVNRGDFQSWLRQKNLAVLITRNVTQRDDFDKQQPFNLRVPGGVQTIGSPGKVYDVARLQLFQADLIRGLDAGSSASKFGRRVLAQVLHDPAALGANGTGGGAPAGSVAVSVDGSVAAFVPAQRALSWQLTDGAGTAVVRERYWVSFQPGEVRMCTNCHGINERDQAGNLPPSSSPAALLQLLNQWKATVAAGPPQPRAFVPLVAR